MRVDKQQQLEGMCMESEAANSKGNSRQLFQIVKSMTQKFQPRLQDIQSATSTVMRKAKELNKHIGGKNLHHFLQRLLVPSVR